ncbi:SDR family NAD(P)-dependent oxidoreductase [Labrys sp. KB_33_2]|uniref:SDR family NAD(P)-dependent oxidoreductase n=1 Tax=Labrys sp. KB_33_2 TaxID=3237479 RepID=UPI003F903F49
MSFEDLQGKSALITGASGRLGFHFAELLVRHGVQVTLAARRLRELEAAAVKVRAAGGVANILVMDVANPRSIAAVFAGQERPFDILVNNAGVVGAADALEQAEADWDLVHNTNLRGAFLVAQAVARGMRSSGRGGAIVNIASILGHRVAGNVGAYAASKAGMIQLTKSLALEWARYGIRVNALCPGYLETDINRVFLETEAGARLVRRIPLRRLGRPQELSGPLLLLASDVGSYMTGSTIEVDGGHLVSTL